MAHFKALLNVLFLALVSMTVASPVDLASRSGSFCTSYQIRREWRSLTITQRLAYIDAVKCLNTLPSVDSSRGTVTRFDDFGYAHVAMTPVIHNVGQFFPWHRHFVTLYDKAMRDECGYTGPTPYWDWTIEGDSSAPFEDSVLFDPVHGFGGDGVEGTYTLPPDPNNEQEIPDFPGNPPAPILWNGCVQDGPFRDTEFRLRIGPGRQQTDHCVVRNFNTASWKPLITTASVWNALVQDDFWTFTNTTHWGPHLGGHAIFGGVMSNGFSTPGDPLFFVHHGAVDRLWWIWQMIKPWKRFSEVAGPTTFDGTDDVTLDFVLQFPGLAPDITIREVMNPAHQPSCYLYA